jgi:ribosomal protein S18 acetylase RimI-like enzyme
VSEAAVRAAGAEDLPAVLELWRAAGSEPTATDDLASLQRLLDHDPGALLVADAGGAIIGSLVAGFDGWRGSFYRLAVHPGHRRRGLATQLLRAGERRLADLGARRLAAIVVSSEEGALGFWAAAGYERQVARERFVTTLPAAG